MVVKRGRPAKITGAKIVDAFCEYYKDSYQKEFKPNFGMIVSAEKISKYYKMTEIYESLKYYFKYSGKDFYPFLNELDSLLINAQNEEEKNKELNDLIKNTQKSVENIERKEIGKY